MHLMMVYAVGKSCVGEGGGCHGCRGGAGYCCRGLGDRRMPRRVLLPLLLLLLLRSVWAGVVSHVRRGNEKGHVRQICKVMHPKKC